MLEAIKGPRDLDHLNLKELSALSDEIRTRVIQVLSSNPSGGHLSSNLGIVELTIALHRTFSSPYDRFIFDTSHQSYIHKILTGRNEQLPSIRQHGGLCGFCHPEESPHDHFFAGHAGTALSLAVGVAKSRDLSKENYRVIPILGDAAFSCGLTFEALNNLTKTLKNFIIILNDNDMSISESMGCMKEVLKNSPDSFFAHFGIHYIGPIDGHSLEELLPALEKAKSLSAPTLVHVKTIKGKGMEIAMKKPTPYHGVRPFHPETGEFLQILTSSFKFPQVFGKHLTELALNHPEIVVITPAMCAGSCLTDFAHKYPERFIDVGIAEGHCLTFAGGLARSKKQKVFASIYSTFLQRALDNLFQDICLQELPVVIALDRSGIAGPDGATHNGIYDLGFIRSMPNLIICQPRDGRVLKELMNGSLEWKNPSVIRYPNMNTTDAPPTQFREIGKGEVLQNGERVLIIPLGAKAEEALTASKLLNEVGITPTIFDPIFIKPFDEETFLELARTHKYIVTIEEHYIHTGLASCVNEVLAKHPEIDVVIENLGIKEQFIHHGSHSALAKELGLDANSLTKTIKELALELSHAEDYQ